jgi:hypothetical protein
MERHKLRERTWGGYARGAERALDLVGSMTNAASRSTILALNCGSSSLKFGLYPVEGSIPNALLSGEVEAIGNDRKQANHRPYCAGFDLGVVGGKA